MLLGRCRLLDASSIPYLISSSVISSSVSQIGISIAMVLELFAQHKILERLMPKLVVADRGNDERGGLRRRVLFAIDR